MEIKGRKKLISIGIAIGIALVVIGGVGALNGWFGGGASIPEDTFTRGLVGYWSMDESDGSLAFDSTTYDNDGMFNDGGSGNPVAYWTFDETSGTTAYDYIGSNNGTLTNGPTWASSGRVGGAIDFDGGDDYVTSGVTDFVQNTGAIEFWFKADEAGDWDRIMDGTNNWGRFLLNGTVFYFDFGGADNVSTTIEIDTWYHVAGTWTGGNSMTLYINGSSVGTNGSVTCPAPSTLFNIGIDSDGSSNPFSGIVDDIKVYDYARAAAQIKRDYIESYKSKWVPGKVAGAMEFDGVDDFVEVPDDDSFDMSSTQNLSLEAWIKTTMTTGGIVVQRFGTQVTLVPYYRLAVGVGTSGKVHFAIRGASSGEPSVNGATDVNDGNWHHIAGVRDITNDKIRVYVDGVEDVTAATDTTTGALAIDKSVWIGVHGSSTPTQQYFDGTIDEVKIYNRALTAAEVRFHYSRGGPVGYWKFDEGSGTLVGDTTDNMNNAIIHGPSLDFDGTDDYVDVGNDSSLQVTNNFTIMYWFQVDNISADMRTLMDKGFNKAFSTGTTDSYCPDSGTKLWFGYPATVGDFCGNTTLTASDYWYFYTVTYDGTDLKMYLNGALDNSSALSLSFDNSVLLTVGKNSFGGYYNGTIDEIRMYNRTFSATEVEEAYRGVFKDESSLVLYLPFDEESGTTAADRSSEGNDGTLTAASTAGTADNGSTTALVDDALTQEADYWNGWIVKIVTTTDALAPQGEIATVTDFTSGDDSLHFAALTAGVDTGDTYKLYYGDENGPTWASREGPTWTTGRFGNALDFDGTDDFLDAGNDSSFNFVTSDFAISTWIKFDTKTTHPILVCRGMGNTDGYYLQVVNSGRAQIITNQAAANTEVGTATGEIGNNQWYHLVAVKSGSTGRIYVNGVDKTSGSTTLTNPVTSTRNLYIGIYCNGTADQVDGTIDEVRIYDYARTMDEIRLDYNRGVAARFGPHSGCDEDPGSCMNYGSVGYWSFDEGDGTTAYDESGEGNDGTLTNNPTWTQGKKNGALKFDGVNDYVLTNSMNYTSYNTGTLMGWLKLDTIIGDIDFFGWRKSGGYESYTNLMIDNPTGEPKFYWDDGPTERWIQGDVDVTDNEWHHVVVTQDGTTVKMYIDSIVQSDTETTSMWWQDMTHSTQSVWIGDAFNTGNMFPGILDEIKIYNRALSATEIRYHYNQGEPVAYWKFDEGSGTLVGDTTDNMNNAIIHGPSLDFDGTDEYVEITSVSALEPTTISVEMWLKTSGTDGSHHRALSMTDSDVGAGVAYMVERIGTSLSFGIYNGAASKTKSYTYTENVWYHLIGIYDNDVVYLYINGESQGTTSSAGTISYTDSDFIAIGRKNAADGEYFDGKIDEVRIYNRVLTATEIKEHYRGLFKDESGLVMYLPMDENTGDTAYDHSTNSNDGDLAGSGLTCPGTPPNACPTWTSREGPSWTTGRFGNALDFDGTDDYLNAGDSSELRGMNTLAVSAWIYPEDTSNANQIVVVSRGYNYWLYIEGTVKFIVWNSGGSGVTSSFALTDLIQNQWSHLIGTYDGSNVKIYLNGVLKDTQSQTGSVRDVSGNLYIGLNPETHSTYEFDGKIDDVRIYDYARSASEIRTDYNAGKIARFGPHSTCDDDPGGCMTNGLVGYWSFDEADGTTAADQSGEGNDGTLTNNPTWTQGKKNGALELDGANDYISIGQNSSINLTTSVITAEAWIKTSMSGTGGIIDKRSGSGGYDLHITGNGDPRIEVKGATNAYTSSSESVNDGNWHHMVGVYDYSASQKLRMFVDGSEISVTINGTVPSIMTSSATDLESGRYNYSSSYSFDGIIDETRIYNRALSATEIRYHYNQGKPVAHWRFEEGEGQTAYDNTDNNNDGTLGSTSSSDTNDPSWAEGRFGGALSFDGADNYITCGTDSSLALDNNLTISTWFKGGLQAGTRGVIIWRVAYDGNDHGYSLEISDYNEARLRVWSGSDGNNTVDSTSSVTNDEWHHIAGVYDGSYMRMYIDGVEENTDAWAYSPTAQSTTVRVGGNSTQYPLAGILDDLRVYNYARSAEEIRKDYNAGAAIRFK